MMTATKVHINQARLFVLNLGTLKLYIQDLKNDQAALHQIDQWVKIWEEYIKIYDSEESGNEVLQ